MRLFTYGTSVGGSPIEEAETASWRVGSRHAQAARDGAEALSLWKAWGSLCERADLWESHPALAAAAQATLAGLGPLAGATVAHALDEALSDYAGHAPDRMPKAIAALTALPQCPSSPAAGSLRKGVPMSIQEAARKPRLFNQGLGLAWCAWSGVAARASIWEGTGLEALWALEEAGVGAKDREVFAQAEEVSKAVMDDMFYACHPWVAAGMHGPKDPLRARLLDLWRPVSPRGLEAAAQALASVGFEQDEPQAIWTLAENGVASAASAPAAAKCLVKALVWHLNFQSKHREAKARPFPTGNAMGRALTSWFDKAPAACSGEVVMDAFIETLQYELSKVRGGRWMVQDPESLGRAARMLNSWSEKRGPAMAIAPELWAKAANALGASMAALDANDAALSGKPREGLDQALEFFSTMAGPLAAPKKLGPRL